MKLIFPWVVMIVCFSGTLFGVQKDASCNITAQEIVGSGSPFQMVVFGDSVVWGNGLRETAPRVEGHKFSAMVARWVAEQKKVQVERTVYAHSAAGIQPSESPDDGKRFPGDVNSTYALIGDQVSCVPQEKRQDINLVLIDGCINDVGGFGIVDPSHSAEWVRTRTKEFCGVPVESMLLTTANTYPHATIIVTGYFRIISEKSDIGPFLDFLRTFFPDQSKVSSLTTQTGRAKVLRQRSSAAGNSQLFYDLSNKLLTGAVDKVNQQMGDKRMHFVQLPFGEENAFGAPKSFLWPIPTLFTGFDEVYLSRLAPCISAYPNVDNFKDLEFCRIDSTAHPNPKGESKIFEAIVKVLSQ